MNKLATINAGVANGSVPVDEFARPLWVLGNTINRRRTKMLTRLKSNHAGSPVRKVVAQAAVMVRKRRQRITTARSLARLNDHMLRDIGISRGEIDYFARQTVEHD